MLARVYSLPLDFEPGSRFSYSNSGYTIVGCLIEKVSGQDYGEFLKEKIFDPLEMKSARLEPVQNSDPLRAIGHDYGANQFSPATYNSPSWAFAAGGIVGSINDLANKPGFSASIARLVEDRLTIAVLSNRTEGNSSKILDEIGKLLLSGRAR